MKRYIKCDNNWYQSSLKHWGRYACYDTVGRRMLECIKFTLPKLSRCDDTVYLNKPIRNLESSTAIVICYKSTLSDLMKDICKIIKDAAKLEGETLSPRCRGNTICYKVACRDDATVCLEVEELNTKEVQKLRQKYEDAFAVYKISAKRN